MNAERIYLVIKKEVILLFRKKGLILTALVLPCIITLVVGFAFTGNIKNVPIIVINEDKGHGDLNYGLVLTNQLTRSDQLDVKYFGNWLPIQTGIDLIRNGKYSAMVFIPQDFTDRLLLGNAYVQVYVDGSDPVVGYTCSSAIVTVVSQLGSKGAVFVAPDFLFNTNVGVASSSIQLNQLRFVIPGQVGVTIAASLTALSASTIVAERERGSFEQLLVSPISGAELLMGKILYHVLVIGVVNIVSILFVVALLDVRIVGSLMLVFLMLFLYAIASTGFGVLISVVSKSQIEAAEIAIFSLTIQVWLSGIVYPIRAMPLILRPVAYGLPLTYLGDALRALMIRGSDFASVQNDFIAVIIYTVIMYVLAVHFFSKRID
ncbi:MAG TPA: ABC transporter permease [Methylomirabilota bacterium]|nr:ABC transporter permease [Methylomirabilota bacterium]